VLAGLRSQPDQDDWLDLTRAAEHLGVHPDTLRKRAKAGLVPFEQDGPGCRVYFRRADLDGWRHAGGAPAQRSRMAERVSARASELR
jgi:excisionase family DNA binding protein